jgi:2-desacetyl-2-hydroxyethyl bacteriochlorophyllide A dehydrogenase
MINTMRAITFNNSLEYTIRYPVPIRNKNEALIRVRLAGICNTDIEITKGYMGFKGVPGHEFTGIVEACDTDHLCGKRVVGEINIGCGTCNYCLNKLKNHCPDRKVLGILNKDGVFAEYVTLPVENLHVIPDDISDEEAIFVEPLAAAFEILRQTDIGKNDRVCVLGDGKLGLLVAQALSATECDLVVVGHHSEKLSLVGELGIKTGVSRFFRDRGFDIVVDCTGSRSGIEKALHMVKPRGKILLKTTVARKSAIDLSQVVINELSIIGSRCGPFADAIEAIRSKSIDLMPLISERFSIEDGLKAFQHASKKDVLKVILEICRN